MIVIIRRRMRRPKGFPKPLNVPSPETIRQLTAEIRAGWSAREYRRRANAPGSLLVRQMPLEPRRKGFWGD